MRQIITTGMVLRRTDFQEADRIVTMLTPDHGKIRLMARGVRKVKSKLAGGIELFCVSQITFIPGRGEISTLVSTRLQTNYGNIVKDINRTMLGYDFLKRINKITEDAAESEYFDLMAQGLEGLDNLELHIDEVDFWFTMRLLQITGHAPNLHTDDKGQPLSAGINYAFNFEDMSFSAHDEGQFVANHIKLLRLSVNSKSAGILTKIAGSQHLLSDILILAKAIQKQSLMV